MMNGAGQCEELSIHMIYQQVGYNFVIGLRHICQPYRAACHPVIPCRCEQDYLIIIVHGIPIIKAITCGLRSHYGW